MDSDKVKLFELPKIEDPRGNLSFLEENNHVPFEVKRSYWIYDVPGGQVRGGHAYGELQEVIIAISGSFDVVIHDGEKEERYFLNRSYYGLYVPQMVWRQLENFSTNSLCLVLASTTYNESDYIRDFKEFCNLK